MNNRIYTTNQAVTALLQGKVGIMPTDTVYGLTARAYDEAAVTRLYALKSRDHKPGTIIAASIEQLMDLGVSKSHLDMARPWWPNPLSIVLPLGEGFDYIHQGLGDVPIRVVIDTQLQGLLERTGPLVTSSANLPGSPSSVTIHEGWNYFGDNVDFYVDGGDLSGRAASTIIRFNEAGEIEVLRAGAVKF